MSKSNNFPFLWLDLELTDLDVKRGHIVEIASLITDGGLRTKAIGPHYVIHQPETVLDNMVRWNREHFAESGLLEEIKTSKISLKTAYTDTLKFIKKHCAFQSIILAGASVHVDREFLGEYMPEIYNYLHHRIIDTNTLKELMHRWYPRLPDFPKAQAHRADKDVLESVNELKYYRDVLFK